MARRWPRLLLIGLCSPILVPLLCISCPLISLAALCLRLSSSSLSRRRRGHRRRLRQPDHLAVDQERVGDGMLHQYLEDQLRLVRSVVAYDQDGEEDGDDEDELASSSTCLC